MNLIAASFAWPFQGRWRSTWAIGVVAVLLLPIAFIPLLGYAVAATRAAAEDPTHGPPRWDISARLFVDGFWAALVLVVITAPFLLALNPLAGLVEHAHVWHVSDQWLSQAYARVASGAILALPWGFILLLLVPHATRRFASTGNPLDLFNFVRAIRGVRRDFAVWNLAAAAMVTAWTLGLACIALACVGVLPGVFYAILVSAHASAAIRLQVEDSSAR